MTADIVATFIGGADGGTSAFTHGAAANIAVMNNYEDAVALVGENRPPFPSFLLSHCYI